MTYPKLIIPKVNEVEKLYIYRSTDANDINTITKVSKLRPVIVIDQSIAKTTVVNNCNCYVLHDMQENINGIIYNGPNVNTVPIIEYETEVNLIMLNSFTPVNELILSPLELNHKEGIVFYYSVIGVNESINTISHLSKVIGVLHPYIERWQTATQVWSCNNYTGEQDDEWTLVNTLEYDETNDKINIGNVMRPYNIERLGIPVVETVPKIKEVHASLNSLISNTFMVLEVQNPWQNNNKEFNYRKLKSYKMCNVHTNNFGEFSTPTYQSELPVSIEKMIIVYKENPDNQDTISWNDNTAKKIEIIRRDGLYYNRLEHKKLGYNLWNIPLENNKLAVFSESSIQDTINIQISAVAGNLYVFDIYLVDVYENVSENTHYVLET